MDIQARSTWAHKREDYTVTVANLPYGVIKTKEGNDAHWQSAVAYTLDDSDDDTLLVRTKQDFEAKFVHLSDDPDFLRGTPDAAA
jgi:hypothetical protein